MNHSEAIESNAAAGYLLGDLTEADRNAFEAHYIDCRVCSATVRDGATMFAAGHDYVKVKEFPIPQPKPKWWSIPASAAASAVLVASLYQGMVIPAVQKAASRPVMEATRWVGKIDSEMRAATAPPVTISFEGDEQVRLEMEIPPGHPYLRYRIELLDPSDKVIETVDRRADQITDGVSLLLSPLPAGSYEMRAMGVREDGNRPELVISGSVVVQ